ncbi:MAG: hypothetical protein U0641_05085 [Anaerolineae bacterium]
MQERQVLRQRAFLVRCWQDGHTRGDGAPAWRFSVEEIGEDHRRYGFTRFEDLTAFLEQWIQDNGE